MKYILRIEYNYELTAVNVIDAVTVTAAVTVYVIFCAALIRAFSFVTHVQTYSFEIRTDASEMTDNNQRRWKWWLVFVFQDDADSIETPCVNILLLNLLNRFAAASTYLC